MFAKTLKRMGWLWAAAIGVALAGCGQADTAPGEETGFGAAKEAAGQGSLEVADYLVVKPDQEMSLSDFVVSGSEDGVEIVSWEKTGEDESGNVEETSIAFGEEGIYHVTLSGENHTEYQVTVFVDGTAPAVQDEKLDIDVASFSTEDTDPSTVLSDLIDLWDVNPLDVVEEYVMLDNDRSSCTATVEEYKKVADGLDVTYEMAYDLYDLAGNETVQTTTWYVHYSGLSDEELKKFSSSEGGQQADMQMSKQETVDGADGGVKSAEEDGIEKVTQEWTVTEVASQQDATEVYTIPATRTTGYQSDMEQGIFQQVNDIRDDNYLNTLLWNEELVPYAKRRALEIIENFSHDSAGGQLENVGENIAEGYPSVDEVMDAWMDSPSHRENILNIYYKSIAVSVYYNGYSYYLVQNFGI